MARQRVTKPHKFFHGTIEQLDAIVLASRSLGRWDWMPEEFWQFRRPDGAILNFWPTTGTFDFQGPPAARDAFERAFVAVVYEARNGRLALPSPGNA